jgi:hypothetical protein
MGTHDFDDPGDAEDRLLRRIHHLEQEAVKQEGRIRALSIAANRLPELRRLYVEVERWRSNDGKSDCRPTMQKADVLRMIEILERQIRMHASDPSPDDKAFAEWFGEEKRKSWAEEAGKREKHTADLEEQVHELQGERENHEENWRLFLLLLGRLVDDARGFDGALAERVRRRCRRVLDLASSDRGPTGVVMPGLREACRKV